MAFTLFGLKSYPTPLWKPIRPFAIGGAVAWFIVYKARQGMMAASEPEHTAKVAHH
ncbi:atp18 subunit J of the mitochondrial F1F0 ATP synthase [Sorochytrium milnesiophthora]